MTGLSPGGGHTGHPNLVGWTAVILKVTAIGRDPLRAAAHRGASNYVSLSTLNEDETNIQAENIHSAAPPPLFVL